MQLLTRINISLGFAAALSLVIVYVLDLFLFGLFHCIFFLLLHTYLLRHKHAHLGHMGVFLKLACFFLLSSLKLGQANRRTDMTTVQVYSYSSKQQGNKHMFQNVRLFL